MKEVTGNLWTYKLPNGRNPDVRVITTNGTVKKDGCCVMGRGCAAEATRLYPGIPKILGDQITHTGNIVHVIAATTNPAIVSFPTKHSWYERADLTLIAISAITLVAFADLEGWQTIVLPRPGCGNGRLRWEDVKPVLAGILDDRFHVITFK